MSFWESTSHCFVILPKITAETYMKICIYWAAWMNPANYISFHKSWSYTLIKKYQNINIHKVSLKRYMNINDFLYQILHFVMFSWYKNKWGRPCKHNACLLGFQPLNTYSSPALWVFLKRFLIWKKCVSEST